MTTYIAKFSASHKTLQVQQHSIFTWKQEGGDIDEELLIGKIKRESSIHFYKLVAGDKYPVESGDITIEISETRPFFG
ncbi:MAG TPA: hypothetical protein VKN36_18155 [Eudoraea sp.]|nr:hypothetical protein [Eudoraea sp.]